MQLGAPLQSRKHDICCNQPRCTPCPPAPLPTCSPALPMLPCLPWLPALFLLLPSSISTSFQSRHPYSYQYNVRDPQSRNNYQVRTEALSSYVGGNNTTLSCPGDGGGRTRLGVWQLPSSTPGWSDSDCEGRKLESMEFNLYYMILTMTSSSWFPPEFHCLF